jgi:hypothetical protein
MATDITYAVDECVWHLGDAPGLALDEQLEADLEPQRIQRPVRCIRAGPERMLPYICKRAL